MECPDDVVVGGELQSMISADQLSVVDDVQAEENNGEDRYENIDKLASEKKRKERANKKHAEGHEQERSAVGEISLRLHSIDCERNSHSGGKSRCNKNDIGVQKAGKAGKYVRFSQSENRQTNVIVGDFAAAGAVAVYCVTGGDVENNSQSNGPLIIYDKISIRLRARPTPMMTAVIVSCVERIR